MRTLLSDLRENVDQRIADYLNEMERFLLFDPIMNSIDLFEEYDSDFLLAHSTDNWAASFIWSFTSELTESGLLEDDGVISVESICDFYSVEKKKVEEEAERIMSNLVNMDFEVEQEFLYNNDFLLNQIRASLAKDEEELLEDLFVIELIFKQALKKRELIINDIKTSVENYNQSELGRVSKARIVEMVKDERVLVITMEVAPDSLELIVENCTYVSDMEFEERIIYTGINMYQPTPAYGMNLQLGANLYLSGVHFQSEEEVRIHLEQLDVNSLDEFESDDPEVRALEFYYEEKAISLKLAEELLIEHPNIIEAKILIAGFEFNFEKRLQLLEEAIEIGQLKFSDREQDESISWWLDYRTRPYLRVSFLYAMELSIYDYLEDSEEVFWDIISKTPRDNLGVRFQLLEIYIREKNWTGFDKVNKYFPDESGPLIFYGEFLKNYYRYGKKSKTRKALFNAFDNFPEPCLILFGFLETETEQMGLRIRLAEIYNQINDLLTYFFSKNHHLRDYFVKSLVQHPEFKSAMEASGPLPFDYFHEN
jgi:hypothetical protein